MKNKIVWFGRVKTIQIQCPECLEWQFEAEKCCECEHNLKDEEQTEQDRVEYRSEISTWRDNIKKSLKEKIYARDEYICQYCGIWCYESYVLNDRSLTIDHLIPFAGGGNSNEENLITCCRECNLIKSDKRFKTFEEARKFILDRKKYEPI